MIRNKIKETNSRVKIKKKRFIFFRERLKFRKDIFSFNLNAL
jgi:hypothetical protein